MKNIIPEFIAQRSQLGEKEGSFKGIALFLDISGFTAMTEELMKGGKLGAESLSQVINSLFQPLISAIYRKGGFVSLFAGDAFTAIFPSKRRNISQKSIDALRVAVEIQNIMKKQGIRRTRHGYFTLSIKVGLASGPIQWGILGDEKGKQCFYFRGPAINLCALAEQQARQGDIVLERGLLASLDTSLRCKELNHKYFLLEPETLSARDKKYGLEQELDSPPSPIAIQNQILERFASRSLLNTRQEGEFRDLASVFLSYQGEPSKKELSIFIDEIMKHCKEMGAYFNSLDFGDKGCTALVLFGAPVAHEDDRVRAAHFSLEIIAKCKTKVRIGISHGTAFAGFVGSEFRTAYTALGKVINVSARLMMNAPWGYIWILDNMRIHLQEQEIFQIKEVGEKHFKGLAQAVKVYQLEGTRKRSFASFEQIDFVGREAEMQRIDEELKKSRKTKKGFLVYYYGKPGSGKSRMLHEIYKKYKMEYEFHFIHAKHLLPKSFYPFSRYLRNHLELAEEESNKALEKIQAKIISLAQKVPNSLKLQKNALLSELKQKISYISATLETQSIKPKLHDLRQQGYSSNVVRGISAFFKLFSLSHPTVLVIEDLHLLDKDSLYILEDLANARISLPLYLLISSRYTDEGKKPTLNLKGNINCISEVLDKLSNSAIEKLLSSRLRGRVEASLLRFIQERTDANAFFIEQFCFYLQSENLLVRTKGGIGLKETLQNLPGEIQSLLVARIDRLSSELREAVQLASVLGLYFQLKVFQELYEEGAKKEEALLRIKEGIREQIWEDCTKGEYKFKDELLLISAYEMQLRGSLRAIHLKTAKKIQELFPKNSDYDSEVAFHYEKAEEIDLARQYYYSAAAQAEEYYKLNQALEYYDRLLPIARHEKEKDALLKKKGEFLDLSGRWDEGISLWDSLYKESLQSSSNKKAGSYLSKMGELYQKKGNYPKAVKKLNEALRFSREAKDSRTLGFASRILGRTLWSMGKYEEAQKTLKRGLLADEQSGDTRGMGMNLYYTGVLYREQGNYERALEYYHKSYEIFNLLADRFYFSYPLYDMGLLYLYRGKLGKAKAYFEQTEQIYAKAGYKSGYSAVQLNIGNIELRKGNFKEAIRFLENSLSLAEEIGESMAIAYSLFNIGILHYENNNYKMTLDYFKRSFAIMRSFKMLGYYGYIFSYLSCLFSRQGLLLRTYRVVLRHFQNMKELNGSDVENGRTCLGMALALVKQEKKLETPPKIVKEISKLSKIDARAEAYYEAALKKARDKNYVSTLIPALYEYASYLHERGFKKKASSLFKEAEEYSKSSETRLEMERIVQRKAKISL